MPDRSRSHIEAAHFDQLVEATGDFNPFTDRGWRTLARRFADASPGATGGRVLDIGCGTGQSRRVYQPRGLRAYVGVDVALEALRKAARRDRDADWLQADAMRLPFADATFDVVAFSSVLHHLGDTAAALVEARRVLRPGGLVFAFDANRYSGGLAARSTRPRASVPASSRSCRGICASRSPRRA